VVRESSGIRARPRLERLEQSHVERAPPAGGDGAFDRESGELVAKRHVGPREHEDAALDRLVERCARALH